MPSPLWVASSGALQSGAGDERRFGTQGFHLPGGRGVRMDQIVKTAIDECRACGRSIYRGQGCPSACKCDDCCAAAGHDHSGRKPSAQPKVVPVPVSVGKESTMSSIDPSSPHAFGQLGPEGDLRLYVQRFEGESIELASQEFLDDLHHESLRSAMLAGG